jgi:hypothetical protein
MNSGRLAKIWLATDGRRDRPRSVCGIESRDVGILADDSEVVVDSPTAAVEFESAMREYILNG